MSKTERCHMFTRGLMIVAMVMIIAISMPTIASASDSFSVGAKVYVNVNDFLNLRAAPQGEIIGQLARGEVVTILAKKDRDGYYQVKVNSSGKTGYCYGEYLTQQKIEKTRNSKVSNDVDLKVGDIYSIHTAVTLRLKKEPSINANYYRFFSDGEQLEILEAKVQEGYVKVRALKDGQVGYAYFKYMTKVKSGSTSSGNPTSSPATFQEGQIVLADVEYKLILRELPNADARALDYLDPGTKLKVLSSKLEGNYIKVETVVTGKIGYCDTRYLKLKVGEENCATNDEPQAIAVGTTMYVNNEGRLNFRSSPKVADNVIYQLYPGEQLRILDPEITEDGFVKVTNVGDGEVGYVMLKYLTTTKP